MKGNIGMLHVSWPRDNCGLCWTMIEGKTSGGTYDMALGLKDFILIHLSGDYVYLQQTTPMTLDVTARRRNLHVTELLSGLLSSGVLCWKDMMVWYGRIMYAIVHHSTFPTLMVGTWIQA